MVKREKKFQLLFAPKRFPACLESFITVVNMADLKIRKNCEIHLQWSFYIFNLSLGFFPYNLHTIGPFITVLELLDF